MLIQLHKLFQKQHKLQLLLLTIPLKFLSLVKVLQTSHVQGYQFPNNVLFQALLLDLKI